MDQLSAGREEGPVRMTSASLVQVLEDVYDRAASTLDMLAIQTFAIFLEL